MNETDKREAEEMLHYLCLGTQVVGVRWPSSFFIEIEPIPSSPTRPDLLLLVESRFAIFPRRPDHFPNTADELPERALEEQVVSLARLAGDAIVQAELGERYSHLILTFDSGRVLFVNGYHSLYEGWTLQSFPGGDWMINSLPGGDVSVTAC